jgi:hypothetical protein
VGALVWADFNHGYQRPVPSPTRPIPLAVPSMEALPEADTESVPSVKKEVNHA